MLSYNKSSVVLACLALYAIAVILVNKTEALDCDRYCKTHRVSVGNCRCRPELFVKKNLPSDFSDLQQDFLLRELLREYLSENDIEERK